MVTTHAGTIMFEIFVNWHNFCTYKQVLLTCLLNITIHVKTIHVR